MSQFKTETNATLAPDAPLFASVWLALFSQLRKNYIARQIQLDANARKARPAKN